MPAPVKVRVILYLGRQLGVYADQAVVFAKGSRNFPEGRLERVGSGITVT